MIRFSVNHRETAARLRATPGEWQKVGFYATPQSASAQASMIRAGRSGSGLCYQPAGSFEARFRREDGGAVLEARYVGERGVAAEFRHQLDTADTAFARLACEHPDRCSCPADYPTWTPGGAR